MPNYCNNNLQVEPTNKSKKAKAQFLKFISDVKVEGDKLPLEYAELYRELYMKANHEKEYRDAVDLYVKHSEMFIKNFMQQIIQDFTYDAETKSFITGQEDFSMDNLLPCPKELMNENLGSYGGLDAKEKDKLRAEMEKKYGYKFCTDWRIANWGCKWGVSEVEIDSDRTSENDSFNYVYYRFDTALSPPKEFLINICEKYPLLNFRLHYAEGGCDFEGDLEIEAGEVITDECGAYQGDGDEVDELENEFDEL